MARRIFILRVSMVEHDQNVDRWRAGVKANRMGPVGLVIEAAERRTDI